MSEPPTTRGHLTPGPHATVVRLPAPDDVAHLVRQLWIPEWDLPAGERAEQLVLGYPASNVVVEPQGVALVRLGSAAVPRVQDRSHDALTDLPVVVPADVAAVRVGALPAGAAGPG